MKKVTDMYFVTPLCKQNGYLFAHNENFLDQASELWFNFDGVEAEGTFTNKGSCSWP